MRTNGAKKLSEKDREVASEIKRIFNEMIRVDGGGENQTSVWISTREIAEACQINIYRARYSLLKLKELGAVVQQSTERKVALGWRPTDVEY